ncbi:MAG: RagB/SusD family nutrient uptake outer membrane protein [Bacteroidales bacterium]|nr:RagB/SusD family nutrient uptake outer membrane protein [Bacteroidales bacterium]MBN2762038.1 RagB/SusD family nutrient uptake outer membrane protein [Bacteroidales bacterium]
MKTFNRYSLIFLLMLGLVTFFSCEDLNVENLNNPDTERVLGSAEDARNVLEGSFLTYWQSFKQTNIHITSLVAADQFSCSWGNFNMRWSSAEPRIPWDNTVTAPNDQVSENFWNWSYAALSQVNDVIRLIQDGMEIGEGGSENDGLLAYGYFMQGWIIGNIGLAFDKGFVVKEYTDLATLDFQPYQEIMDSAVVSMENAIAYAAKGSFELSSTVINGVTVDDALISGLAHSFIARFLALTPRNKAQNDAVNWQKVLDHANLGITEDFGPQGDGSPYEGATWWDENIIYLVNPGWARIDNRIINLMDPAYPKNYWADGVAQVVHTGMNPGEALSNDARLLSDFEFLPAVDFRPERGYWHFTNYRCKRFDDNMWLGLGTLHEFRAYENELYKAEAAAMLGQLDVAVGILNNADLPRKARGELDDIAAGASKDDILKAIFYERDIELIAQGFLLGFYDMRRRDMLQIGQYLHYPVPGKELETLGLEIYTFGGVSKADGVNTSNGGWF